MKNRFLTGLVAGIVSSALLVTGGCGLEQSGDWHIVNQSTSTPTANDKNDKNEKENKEDAGTNWLDQLLGGGSSAAFDSSELIDSKANYIMRLISSYYLYGDVKKEDYQTAIYRALLDACDDPYSCYYTPDEYKDMMESSTGTYCGIGCLVSQDAKTKIMTIVRPFKDSPAAKAGIQAGDVIYKVDGEDMTGQDINLVVSKMKGPENTNVKITMYRGGRQVEFEVTRGFIEVETVTMEKIEQDGKKIGLIAVTEFDEVTTTQFENSIKDLQDWGCDGLVIDLRDNPGGYVDTAVAMLDVFLPKGIGVYMLDKQGQREDYKLKDGTYELPISIIVNENSASASELFSGAMQDNNAAVVVGTQSFGKGIVQSVIPLGDGSAIKLTIADYYTPNGRNIHGVGITPDVVVELPEGKMASTVAREEDTQLAAAIDEVLKQLH